MRTVRPAVAACAAVLGLTACASSSAPKASPTTTSTTGSTPSASVSSTPASTPTPPKTYTSPPATLPVAGWPVTMSTGPAPWPAPVLVGNGVQSPLYVAAAGLPALGGEMLGEHYHAHLDIVVDGKAVPVPPYLGYVLVKKKVSLAPLHTHDESGVIHIENDRPAQFLLGQVFVEWGVRLTATCLGGYCAGNGKELAVFVNGQRRSGDPGRIVLNKHDEIAIEYGPSGNLPTPPSSYHFSNGL